MIEKDPLTHAVIGAAIEVHRLLGPGYLERTYEEALAIELRLRGIEYSRQHPIALTYKGHSIGEGRLDFLVGGELIVELKTVDALADIHKAQVISYLNPIPTHLFNMLGMVILALLLGVDWNLLQDGCRVAVSSLSDIRAASHLKFALFCNRD